MIVSLIMAGCLLVGIVAVSNGPEHARLSRCRCPRPGKETHSSASSRPTPDCRPTAAPPSCRRLAPAHMPPAPAPHLSRSRACPPWCTTACSSSSGCPAPPPCPTCWAGLRATTWAPAAWRRRWPSPGSPGASAGGGGGGARCVGVWWVVGGWGWRAGGCRTKGWAWHAVRGSLPNNTCRGSCSSDALHRPGRRPAAQGHSASAPRARFPAAADLPNVVFRTCDVQASVTHAASALPHFRSSPWPMSPPPPPTHPTHPTHPPTHPPLPQVCVHWQHRC